MKKQKTINVRDIWSCKLRYSTGSKFALEFWNEKYCIVLHLRFYQVGWVASNIWKAIKQCRQEWERLFSRATDAMNEGEPK